jgi:hypothetical protein
VVYHPERNWEFKRRTIPPGEQRLSVEHLGQNAGLTFRHVAPRSFKEYTYAIDVCTSESTPLRFIASLGTDLREHDFRRTVPPCCDVSIFAYVQVSRGPKGILAIANSRVLTR